MAPSLEIITQILDSLIYANRPKIGELIVCLLKVAANYIAKAVLYGEEGTPKSFKLGQLQTLGLDLMAHKVSFDILILWESGQNIQSSIHTTLRLLPHY